MLQVCTAGRMQLHGHLTLIVPHSCRPTLPVSGTCFDKLVLIYLFTHWGVIYSVTFCFYMFCFGGFFFYLRAHMSIPHLLAFIYERWLFVMGLAIPKHPPDMLQKTERGEIQESCFFFPFPLSTTTEMCKEYKVCAVYTQPSSPSLFFPSLQSKLSCWEAATGQQDTEPSFFFLLVQIDLSSTFPISFPLFWSIVKDFLVRPCLFGLAFRACIPGCGTNSVSGAWSRHFTGPAELSRSVATPHRLSGNQCPAHLLYGLWLRHSHVLDQWSYCSDWDHSAEPCPHSTRTPHHSSLLALVEGKMTICCPSCPVNGQQPSLMAQFHSPLSAWDIELECACVYTNQVRYV